MTRLGWALVVAASLTLALLSLASNVTTVNQLTGEADMLLTTRSSLSKVVNSGTAWAGLLVFSGWLVRRPAQALAAGITAALTALVAHYGVGQLFNVYGSTIWTTNLFWFEAALVAGGPLGLVGAAARRHDLWGLLARLVVPIGAVVEPFLLGMFTQPEILPWPNRVSSVVSGVVLVATGAASGATVLARHRMKRSTTAATRPTQKAAQTMSDAPPALGPAPALATSQQPTLGRHTCGSCTVSSAPSYR